MRLAVAGALSTFFVIFIGFLLIIPLFTQVPVDDRNQVMLSISVEESEDVVNWCKNLSSMLESYNIGATIFFVGEVAANHPECVSYFGEKVDIGSQTFSNRNLTDISDYNVQLEEIENGKLAVDSAANLYSRVFRAPNGAVDQNIYSLLSRNDILADFSYDSQYNIYLGNQFVKFNAASYEGDSISASSVLTLEDGFQPVIVHFDNYCSLTLISDYISILQSGNFAFVNASQLAGLNLTLRGDN